ncbi:Hypothetical predicted protein [Mytilus galloprovincialis]|uniref:Uncharacterized protein n=3 Tax=Mytilus galloprovincialis TaxID=29158 RepID=A0A8B6HJQ9_MYTGA|nr:Hypothetical predicted protein [Mytilus galloprovincialis]
MQTSLEKYNEGRFKMRNISLVGGSFLLLLIFSCVLEEHGVKAQPPHSVKVTHCQSLCGLPLSAAGCDTCCRGTTQRYDVGECHANSCYCYHLVR